MRLRIVMITSGLAAVVAFLLARLVFHSNDHYGAPPAPPAVPPAPAAASDANQREARPDLAKINAFQIDDEAIQAGALPGQRVLIFKTQADLEAFLKQAAANGISIIGRLDKLNALRVGFLNPNNLALLSGQEMEMGFIFPITVPDPKPGSIQADAVGLGANLADWLNVSGDRSTWGNGVKVAVLDTGVVEHRALGDWSQIALVPLPTDGSPLNPHGLAVASLITGNLPQVSGAAPGIEQLLSIVVADHRGQSDTFTLASGIITAVDAGANPLIISMGADGDSALMRQAVAYAQQHQVVIVAAAGNEGIAQIAYPAAYASNFNNVVAVGAVDARGEQMSFSNSGAGLTLMAPGYQVNAAYAGDRFFEFTGTSASAPVVGGAIAVIMSQGGVSAQQAVQTLVYHANEGGVEGVDSYYGHGLVDLGRALQGNKPGVTDVAVASQTVSNGKLFTVLENRGTDTVYQPVLDVTIGGNISTIYGNSLVPGETRTVSVPFSASATSYGASVRISGGQIDVRPANNSSAKTITTSVSR